MDDPRRGKLRPTWDKSPRDFPRPSRSELRNSVGCTNHRGALQYRATPGSLTAGARRRNRVEGIFHGEHYNSTDEPGRPKRAPDVFCGPPPLALHFARSRVAMKLVVFGLTISSSWGNGHATLWRGLCRALGERGHTVIFFEQDRDYYASHRDYLRLPCGQLRLYSSWSDVRESARAELADADVGLVTSYCPDGIAA